MVLVALPTSEKVRASLIIRSFGILYILIRGCGCAALVMMVGRGRGRTLRMLERSPPHDSAGDGTQTQTF